MAFTVTDTMAQIVERFTSDAEPDFQGVLVMRAIVYNALTPLQLAALRLAKLNEWRDARVPIDPDLLRQGLINALKRDALAKWQAEHDLGVVATVDPNGTVTVT